MKLKDKDITDVRRILSSVARSFAIIATLAGCGDDDKGPVNSAHGGIYAESMVRRNVNNSGIFPPETDVYVVRLDSSYAPDSAIKPIGSAEVTCNGDSLGWSDVADTYYYPIDQGIGKFIQLGATYTFTIAASEGLPALTQSITFPELEPWMRTPE